MREDQEEEDETGEDKTVIKVNERFTNLRDLDQRRWETQGVRGKEGKGRKERETY